MKLEEQNLNEPHKPQLNIDAVSGSISEIAIEWWYNLSDYKTDELIIKHNMRKPIKEAKIIEVYNIEVDG